ncbi:sensor histidine kinase [Labilibacter marinus]|uniref:sensor histidine kinase n=1 Tax=Labilibacter marinus TaxID=1477105 RepID=UPI000836BAC1|nr:histidine kinase [Labilibacter marinus]
MQRKINLNLIVLHLLCWLLLFASPLLFLYNFNIATLPYKQLAIVDSIILGIFYINYSGLVPLLFFRKRFAVYIIAIISLLGLAWWIVSYLEVNYPVECYMGLFKRNTLFIVSSKTVNTHSYDNRLAIFLVVSLALVAIGTSIRATGRWLNNEKENNLIKKEKLNAELSYLKSQIDPHFFFNTLNNIYSLTQLKSDKAPQTILKLSELMRYNIYEADKKMVRLEDEINYVQNFIDLQRIRLAKSVDIDYYVRGVIGSKMIEPLIFLPFIENAFKHGIDYANNCSIDIEISIEDTEITLLVINNTGSRKEKISKQSGVGLSNIKKRLELLYKNRYDLNINENDESFMVKLILYSNGN